MRRIEYHIDVWDLRGMEPKPDVMPLLEHLNEFGQDGWQLAVAEFNIELARHGECHLLIFTRPVEDA